MRAARKMLVPCGRVRPFFNGPYATMYPSRPYESDHSLATWRVTEISRAHRVGEDGAKIVRFQRGTEAVKFRNADTIYAGATGPRAAIFQCAVRHSYSRDVFTEPSTAYHNGASLEKTACVALASAKLARSYCHAGAR